jgi:hypothetical protein
MSIERADSHVVIERSAVKLDSNYLQPEIFRRSAMFTDSKSINPPFMVYDATHCGAGIARYQPKGREPFRKFFR